MTQAARLSDRLFLKAVKLIFLLPFFGYVLVINGAVPGYMTPTLGQAVWITGFAKSLANSPTLSIFAHDIGLPQPAAISFGLPGAVATALGLKAGLDSPDAYSLACAFWLAIAFWGAFSLIRHFQGSFFLGLFGATIWLTFPVVWQHTGYSMLSIGIALIPAYYLSIEKLLCKDCVKTKWYIIFPAMSLISSFMDGYSFMMFASISLARITYEIYFSRISRYYIYASIYIILSIGVSAALYILYCPADKFAGSLEFFRGWGADISFLISPPKNLLLLPDMLDISSVRNPKNLFGDSSVYRTSYLLIPLAISILCISLPYGDRKKKYFFFFVGCVALYLSLGPSFKFNSFRPDGVPKGMPAEYALGPTGTAFLWEYVPGLQNMRAVYRWVALALVGFWGATMVVLADPGMRKGWRYLLLGALLLFNVPYIGRLKDEYTNYRKSFLSMDITLNGFSKYFKRNEKVVFLPYYNDFLVNYMAPTLGIRTYNIGGDKNVSIARENWPLEIRTSPFGKADDTFVQRVIAVLAEGEADAVAVPYIDLLLAALSWPPDMSGKEKIYPYVEQLKLSRFVHLTETPYFAVVRLRPEFAMLSVRERLDLLERDGCLFARCLVKDGFKKGDPSQTGRFHDGVISSVGKAGYMVFGPYLPLRAGTYHLTVFGTAPNPDGAFVDVAAGMRGHLYGKFPIHATTSNLDVLLVDEEVTLTEDEEKVQVRVFVKPGSRVSVKSYRFVPTPTVETEDLRGDRLN